MPTSKSIRRQRSALSRMLTHLFQLLLQSGPSPAVPTGGNDGPNNNQNYADGDAYDGAYWDLSTICGGICVYGGGFWTVGSARG